MASSSYFIGKNLGISQNIVVVASPLLALTDVQARELRGHNFRAAWLVPTKIVRKRIGNRFTIQ